MPLDPSRRTSSALAWMRWHMARRPWIGRLVVAALALVAGSGVLRAEQRAESARAAWGDTVDVLVADVDIGPGDPLQGAVSTRSRPQPLVPPTALRDAPPGAVARQRIAAGELLVATDVAPAPGAAALVPDGWLAVAIVLDRSSRPPVETGDGVTVVAGSATIGEGVVVALDDDRVVVAMPADSAPEAAAAASSGDANILWSGRLAG